MSTIPVILAVLAIALLLIMVVARQSPHGYEDTDGFHFGRRK